MWMKREVQVAVSIIEKITLSTFGRDKRPLEALVGAAMDHRIERELNRIAVYVPSPYNNEWTRARLGNNRKLDSVVLKTGQKEAITPTSTASSRRASATRRWAFRGGAATCCTARRERARRRW